MSVEEVTAVSFFAKDNSIQEICKCVEYSCGPPELKLKGWDHDEVLKIDDLAKAEKTPWAHVQAQNYHEDFTALLVWSCYMHINKIIIKFTLHFCLGKVSRYLKVPSKFL